MFCIYLVFRKKKYSESRHAEKRQEFCYQRSGLRGGYLSQNPPSVSKKLETRPVKNLYSFLYSLGVYLYLVELGQAGSANLTTQNPASPNFRKRNYLTPLSLTGINRIPKPVPPSFPHPFFSLICLFSKTFKNLTIRQNWGVERGMGLRTG